MSKLKKRIAKLFANPRDCTLQELQPILEHYGFKLERISGSHHIFSTMDSTGFVIPVHKNKVKKVYVIKFKKIVKIITIPYED